MSVKELESAVQKLSRDDLKTFWQWMEEYVADEWDRQIEDDIRAGRLDKAGKKADEDFEAGRCTVLHPNGVA